MEGLIAQTWPSRLHARKQWQDISPRTKTNDGPTRGTTDDLESPTGYSQGTFIVLPEVAFASRRFAFSSVIVLEFHLQVTNDKQHFKKSRDGSRSLCA